MVFKNHVWKEEDSSNYICPILMAPAAGMNIGCFGKKCAMWRWHETNIPNEDGIPIPNGETMGFCGLAGPTYQGSMKYNYKADK